MLEDEDLKSSRAKRSPEDAIAAKNMYIVLWRSFVNQIKTAMQTVADNNKVDDSVLICHLLCQYKCTAELVIRTYQSSVNNLSEKLEKLNFDIDKFCNYTSKTHKTLQDAGGDDKQALHKPYKALMLTIVDTFSSEIRAYKAAMVANDKGLDFTNLSTIAKAKYTSLKMCDQWFPSLPRAPAQRKEQSMT
eukprot:15360637-Ditylum_brightwellii.AAC.1